MLSPQIIWQCIHGNTEASSTHGDPFNALTCGSCPLPWTGGFQCFQGSCNIFFIFVYLQCSIDFSFGIDLNQHKPKTCVVKQCRKNWCMQHTGAKKELRGIASSRSTGICPSNSGGIITFFTTGTGPCTSYSPILWLNVASPKRTPGSNAASEVP